MLVVVLCWDFKLMCLRPVSGPTCMRRIRACPCVTDWTLPCLNNQRRGAPIALGQAQHAHEDIFAKPILACLPIVASMMAAFMYTFERYRLGQILVNATYGIFCARCHWALRLGVRGSSLRAPNART
jgi:hypothetical protein